MAQIYRMIYVIAPVFYASAWIQSHHKSPACPQPAELFRQQGFFDLVSGFQYAAKQKLRRYVERVGDGDVTGIITDCGKIREYETLCFMRNDTFLCSD